ncbi:hypothetical protein, partial [Pseudoalteromonas luteoviolacea]|uniref:hypothetical protein n=1 Tax=Pseudoalteromonas luteoviolacea TaxID=43657 RepID=UPI001E5BE4D4
AMFRDFCDLDNIFCKIERNHVTIIHIWTPWFWSTPHYTVCEMWWSPYIVSEPNTLLNMDCGTSPQRRG